MKHSSTSDICSTRHSFANDTVLENWILTQRRRGIPSRQPLLVSNSMPSDRLLPVASTESSSSQECLSLSISSTMTREYLLAVLDEALEIVTEGDGDLSFMEKDAA